MPIRFDHKPGLVVYLTAGDPGLQGGQFSISASLNATREIAVAAIDAGANVIELGVPFSDPLADGPIIQRASERALAHGMRLRDVLALAREIRAARPKAGLVIFSYLNPMLRYGLSKFADDAAAAGVDGVLATDMIVEEAAEYLAEMSRVNLAPIFLAAPTSPDARLEAIAALVKRIRRNTRLPVAVGFGISNAEHVAQVAEFADAAVIGSAIVELIERSTPERAPGAVARFIRGLRLPQAALAR
jgi:tryptophan synthase alpha chain